MLTFGRVLLVALFALAPTQVFSGAADEANALFARWKAAYDANDNVAVAKLYATDAILHGTRSRDLTIGREAITKYFTVVVGTGNKVEFRERELRVLCFAPAGTPEPVVNRLNEVVNAGLRDKATADKLQVQGIVPRLMSAAEYRAFVVAEAEKFGKIVQQANIKLQN